MRNAIRQAVDAWLPTPVVYHIHHAYHALTLSADDDPNAAILPKLPDPPVVVAGPFKGLSFHRAAFSSAIAPSLLGTYEMEVHPAVETLCGLQADRIITIGAGEGYYTVGMARRNPQALNIGFEMFKPARHLCVQTARMNGVADRVQVRGTCTPAGLADALRGAARPIVICDCEGAEDILLDPAAVPDLRRTHVLVEIHDHMCAGVSGRIRERFAASHQLTEYVARPRTAADLPEGHGFTPEEVERYIVERRRGVIQSWYLLVPQAAAAEPASGAAQ